MDLEQKAIERLKMASEMSLTYYEQPLIITTSGGKDSDVCLELAKRAGIPYEVMHNHTTADAPQTVYHVRQQFQKLELEGVKCSRTSPRYKGHPTSMWSLIVQKLMPPTRVMRYCCTVLKEGGGAGRLITTGVRWAESVNRKSNRGIYEKTEKGHPEIMLMNDNDDARRIFEDCRLKAKRICNPIVDWTDSDVWGYIQSEHIEINPLYSCGFNRVGCIGCPMAGNKRYFEFRMFPAYERMYRRAFEKMIQARAAKNIDKSWKTADEVFRWWMGEDPNQMTFDDVSNIELGEEVDK